MNQPNVIPPSGSRSEAFRIALNATLAKHGIAETLPEQTALQKTEELIPVEYFEDGTARIEPTWFEQYKQRAACEADHDVLVYRLHRHMAETQQRPQ